MKEQTKVVSHNYKDARLFCVIEKALHLGLSLDELEELINPEVCDILHGMKRNKKPLQSLIFAYTHVIDNELEDGDDVNDYETIEAVNSALSEINRELNEYERSRNIKDIYKKLRG